MAKFDSKSRPRESSFQGSSRTSTLEVLKTQVDQQK